VVACPFSASGGGDNLSRGFYVSNYAANNIHTVTLGYEGSGRFTITLAAHKRRYDGAVLGRVRATVRVSTDTTKVAFDFGNVAVRRGTTIAFKQRAAGNGDIFYNVGRGNLGDQSYDKCPGVTETTRPSMILMR
jgi:hypothetical protein